MADVTGKQWNFVCFPARDQTEPVSCLLISNTSRSATVFLLFAGIVSLCWLQTLSFIAEFMITKLFKHTGPVRQPPSMQTRRASWLYLKFALYKNDLPLAGKRDKLNAGRSRMPREGSGHLGMNKIYDGRAIDRKSAAFRGV